MKNNHHTLSKALGITLLVILGVTAVFFLFDFTFNGMFVDWFDGTFMTTYEEYIPEAGRSGIVRRPNWDQIKQLLFFLVVCVLLIGILAVALVSHFYARYRVRKNIAQISRMLRDYTIADKDADGIFPSEYRDIAAQMASIREQMTEHERIIREETSRKNDLILYLAHDLKTPLASVIGYLDLLRDERQISEELQEKYLGIALHKAERLEELINEFFEIARFNLSDISLQYGNISLTRLLEQLIFEFQPMLKDKNLTCSLEAPEDLKLRCDADKLQRVFDNLLRNAVIYSFKDTAIHIQASQVKDQVTVTFTNTGETIPKEKLDRIFEQFYRLDLSRNTGSGGAGLGLAIAKRIVELHHGTIRVQSLDEQTCFTVTLPAVGKS